MKYTERAYVECDVKCCEERRRDLTWGDACFAPEAELRRWRDEKGEWMQVYHEGVELEFCPRHATLLAHLIKGMRDGV